MNMKVDTLKELKIFIHNSKSSHFYLKPNRNHQLRMRIIDRS